ncbi:MAG: Ger(x)C family spore germination protein [Bacillota bacterium]
MKKVTALFLILVILLFAGGCWDWRIIDDLAIIFGMGIDPVENEPEMLQITFVNPVFNPKAQEKSITRTLRGRSLQQTLFNLQHQKGEQPVLGTVAVIIFSEDAARGNGMQRTLMQFDQIRDNSPLAWLCIVREAAAQKVLNLNLPDEPRPAIFLADLLKQNYAEGRIPQITASTYWIKTYTPGITPVIPVIALAGPEGEEPNGILLAGLAVIDEAGRMRGSLSDTETLIYMMLAGDMLRGRFYTQIDFPDQTNLVITAFIEKSSSSVKTKIVDGNAVIEIKADLVLNGMNADLAQENILREDVFRELEESLARDIEGNMRRVIKKTQEWESDIFGFGQLVRAQNPQWFKEISWAREYSESDIRVEAAVKIKRLGTLANPTR